MRSVFATVFVATYTLFASDSPLQSAYDALQVRDYDSAIAHFRVALRSDPLNPQIRKDLAYTLLKTGDREQARDEFSEIYKTNPKDWAAGLEFAFLAFETLMPAEARRTFDGIRRQGDEPAKTTASQAFENIDAALSAGIARWKEALLRDPKNFSAHEELARLAAERDDFALAAEHYRAAWQLRPDKRALLFELGRALQAQNLQNEANPVLLAVSRNAEPFTAEKAKALLPQRYPYPYEFEQAIQADPTGLPLRREYAYLLIAMDRPDEALRQFDEVLRLSPKDDSALKQVRALKAPVLQKETPAAAPPVEPRLPAREMGLRSYQKGFYADAERFLTAALEDNPSDHEAALRLGWTLNQLKRDEEALRWFSQARRSPDPAIASEAEQAWRNLRPAYAAVRYTFWAFPLVSSRWNSAFVYAQGKAEFRIKGTRLRPYLSSRLVADFNGSAESGPILAGGPIYLSERSVILAGGLSAMLPHNLYLWAEAGEAIRYTGRSTGYPFMIPDYRGGAAWGKGWGHLLGAETPGLFAEINADAVFVSRFQNDTIFSVHTRGGYTGSTLNSVGGLQWQAMFHARLNVDWKRQYWANFSETGPGIRWRWSGMPRNLFFNAEYLRGDYFILTQNPYGPRYYEWRAGLWYAFTR